MTQQLEQQDSATLTQLKAQLELDYELVAANRLALDLSRGKPAAQQLALSDELDGVLNGNYIASDGTDVRNYGGLRGIPEARALGEEICGVPADNIIVGGNSSLNLMYLAVNTALHNGLCKSVSPWRQTKQVKLLTPVPGYDRHFTLSAALGIEMVPIDINADGPDLEQALALASSDEAIKGIWCVPKYSNPTGCIYSDAVVEGLAALPNHAAANNFVVLWDNAYAVHDFQFPTTPLASIFEAAQQLGTQDHVVQFASTSKITFAGAGIAFVGASEAVLQTLEQELSVMTVGPDKINQLRHTKFLNGRIEAHMQAHADIIKPKFDTVITTLEEELGGLGVATWTVPKGGYFVSLDLRPGLAKIVVAMAQRVGLTLTPAGAPFPHGQDPLDGNVRIAPTFANLPDLKAAMQILTLCVKLASIQQIEGQQC